MRWLTILSILNIVYASAAVLGIDYGTDFIKSSLVAPNSPFEIVLTPDSQRKDASGLVLKPGSGDRVYGSSGVGLASKFPDSSLYSVKPLLGVPYNDLRVALFEQLHPGLQLAQTSRNSVAFNLSGAIIPVEEVVAMQVKDVKDRATSMLREKTHSKTAVLRDIALSVPGHFGSSQRQALIDSVGLVDVNLVGLVNDGVAIAINYANSPAISSKLSTEKHYVVVYDSGAAATSSTLVSLKLSDEDETIVEAEVEGFGSSGELSGHSLTSLIREMLIDRFFKSHKPVERTPRFLNRLWKEAERAKYVLSANTDVHIHIESLAEDVDFSTKISREEFETAASDIIDEVLKPLRESLTNFGGHEVDAVVLAGGTSRTPFVLQVLGAEVGESKLSKNVNADEANVQGTCMRGVNLSGLYRSKRRFEVKDVSAHWYEAHIRTTEDSHPIVSQLFDIGSSLGSEKVLELPPNVSQVEIYENRKKLISWDLPYAKQNIDSLFEPGPYTCVGKASLQATFKLDDNGVFRLGSIEAVCPSVKSPSSSTVSPSITSKIVRPSEDIQGETTNEERSTGTSLAEETQSEAGPSTQSDGKSRESSKPHLKTRRVSTQPSWVQGPIGSSERSEIRSHLNALDQNDEDRKLFSVLHHELESLTYRIRAMVSAGEARFADLSEALLEWIEEGSTSLAELRTHLQSARDVFESQSSSTETLIATSSNEHPVTEKDASYTAGDDSSAEGAVHDEL